jgi:hypothetical protein
MKMRWEFSVPCPRLLFVDVAGDEIAWRTNGPPGRRGRWVDADLLIMLRCIAQTVLDDNRQTFGSA